MADTWTIVIFTDEDAVEVVPSDWIVNKKCHWPHLLTPEKLKASIKNHDPLDTCWPSFPIRLIRSGTFDDYYKAEEKCKRAEYSSDINSDGPLGNKRKVKKKTYGSSFDEDNLSSSSDDNNLSTPPRLITDTSTSISKTKSKKKSEAINNDRFRNENLEKMLSQPIDNNDSSNGNDELFRKSLNNNERECKCCPVHIKHNCDKYFKEIIRQQNIFKASMWQYTDSLHELTTSVNRILTNDKALYQVEEATTLFFTMFHFPLEDEEQLICVNEYLNNEKNFNAAMNELEKIGGSSVKNFNQRALQRLISNNLAEMYSWFGRRGKKAFYKLKLADLIIGSVKKSIPNSTNKECEEAIQKWLRRAKERNDNYKKRGENNI